LENLALPFALPLFRPLVQDPISGVLWCRLSTIFELDLVIPL